MCGICGFFDPSGQLGESDLAKMAERIRHRGPDDYGVWLGPGVGLASRRLSIIDLDAGRQPIANECSSVRVVFNGEIYNFAALREKLRQCGHQFRTRTDTEVLVHLYEEHGCALVDHLEGMFAFALWDQPRRRLLLARDHLGQKPLYFFQSGPRLVFASEIKALLEVLPGAPAMDLQGMHQCLSLRSIVGQETMFEGIKKLPAAHRLVVEDGAVKLEPYWDLEYVPKRSERAEALRDELAASLQQIVAEHMVGDVPVGAFLSGGIDSSVLVALMARHAGPGVKTFSIGVRDASFNELPYARLMARHCQTQHHERIIDPNVVASLPRMIYAMEEPVDPFAFGVYAAAELASEHVKVVLGGDGGDEMFAGYDRYLGQRLADLYCALPAALRRAVIEPVIRRLPDSYKYNNRVQKLRWLVAMSRHKGPERYAESACFLRFTHGHKASLYSELLWRRFESDDAASHLVQYYLAAAADDPVDRMLYTDVKSRLAEHLLMIADRMTMAHSIEGRSPYVDRRIASLVARFPVSLKIHRRRLKYVLRWVGRDLMPAELLQRGKQGFSFPLARWFENELREVFRRMVECGRLVEQGIFRAEGVARLLDEHVRRQCDHNYRLWLLLNTELWYRLFVERQSCESLQAELDSAMASQTPRAVVVAAGTP